MIPTLLVAGFALGFISGAAHRLDVLLIGVFVSLIGWWVLLFTVGDVAFSPGTLAGTTVFALGNLAVGTLVGWGLALGIRALFGMTTER